MIVDYNLNLTPIAQTLRREMTPQEQKLWYQFLTKQRLRFQRQKPIHQYVVDFYCYRAKLLIEIDGAQHHEAEAAANDEYRDAVFASIGLAVQRFTNSEIDNDFANTCKRIMETIHQRTAVK